jgi:uncharacterized membrane protein YhaH (DUF805 family)
MDKYYKILGLPEGASQLEIKDAYDRLAKELDPLNNENQEFFIEEYNKLKEAFEMLSNSSILIASKNEFESSNLDNFNYEEPSKSTSTSNNTITITISEDKIQELKQNEISEKTSASISNKDMFQNLFSFDGRIRRTEYGISIIIYYIYLFIVAFLTKGQGLYFLFLIPGLWFLWSQGAKRCHDRNNNGWWQIIPFYLLWLLFAEGDNGDNDFGSSPK